jgi:hypothetical protein
MPIKRLMPTIAITLRSKCAAIKEGGPSTPGGSQERRQATDRIFREQKQARSFRLMTGRRRKSLIVQKGLVRLVLCRHDGRVRVPDALTHDLPLVTRAGRCRLARERHESNQSQSYNCLVHAYLLIADLERQMRSDAW